MRLDQFDNVYSGTSKEDVISFDLDLEEIGRFQMLLKYCSQDGVEVAIKVASSFHAEGANRGVEGVDCVR